MTELSTQTKLMDLGLHEVAGVSEVEGPILVVEGIEKVGYDEVVEIIDRNGELRRGRVLEVGEAWR